MDRLTVFFFSALICAGMIIYSADRNMDILVFVFITLLTWISLSKTFELLKDWIGTRRHKGDSTESQLLKERLENLENLLCRMDLEMNAQLERSLLQLKEAQISPGISQSPTAFGNIASALEERYQIMRELGRGGMGIIFQAYDKELKEQVAIKILSPLLSNDPEARERMKREVSAARRVTHPNVIRIHDFSEVRGLHYVSMEFFHGTNLRDYIHHEPLKENEFMNLALQICDGLEAAHRQGVVHRDLKSQNIIVNATGQAKIIDFGLARTSHLEGMTATGLIMGTPEYMAPEQVSGKRVDERADIYSLGIILYEMCTGKVPFRGDSAIAVAFKQMKESPVSPNETEQRIHKDLEKIIMKALDKDPLKRQRSVAELKAALEAVAVEKSSAGILTSAKKQAEDVLKEGVGK